MASTLNSESEQPTNADVTSNDITTKPDADGEALDVDVSEDAGKPHFERCYAKVIRQLKSDDRIKDIEAEFRTLKTDEDRFKFMAHLDIVNDAIDITIKTVKDYDEALLRRETGNGMFRKRYYADAHELYTQSIQLFPVELDTEQRKELGKAFANRATTACHMDEYNACLVDITRAFDLGYPDHLRYKLYEKQAKCYKQLKKYSDAVVSLKSGIENLLVAANEFPNDKKVQLVDDLRKQTANCARLAKNSDSEPKAVKPKEIPRLTKDSSEQFINANKLFGIAYDDKIGRHGVAKESISVGEIIIVEKPFASIVLKPFYDTHCYYCFSRLKSPLACDHCTQVRFCNETCKIKAWLEFHDKECSVLSYITSTDNCWGHLAHRIIVKLGFENLVKFREYYLSNGASSNREKFGANSGEVFNSTDFQCVHALVTHAQDRDLADLFFRSVKAVYLMKCLQKSVFFTGADKDLISFTGGLLLSNLQLCPCNAHEVSELHVTMSNIEKTKSSEIGAGLYPTLSLLNHSCDPNVVRYFYGDVCVTRAIHHIPKGGQIVDNYGALYPTQPLDTRREVLRSQYFFTCNCRPCEQDWPLYTQLAEGEDAPPILKCEKCSEPLLPTDKTKLVDYPCGACGCKHDIIQRMSSLDESHNHFAQALARVLRGEPSAVRTLERHLDLMDKLLVLPWKMFNNAQEALKHHYGMNANCFTLP